MRYLALFSVILLHVSSAEACDRHFGMGFGSEGFQGSFLNAAYNRQDRVEFRDRGDVAPTKQEAIRPEGKKAKDGDGDPDQPAGIE